MSCSSPSTAAWRSLVLGLAFFGVSAVQAQPPGPIGSGIKIAESVSIEAIDCLPTQQNPVVWTSVQGMPPSLKVRLYFRRLNPEGSPYFVESVHESSDRIWATLPKPEQTKQETLTDAWWETLKTRDWMQYRGHNRQWLETWLGQQSLEAAEIFAGLVDHNGQLLERSEVLLVQVRADCPATLDPKQAGEAGNLIAGETNELQADRGLFHWLCDGVVSRRSAAGVLEADQACRGCVLADQ